MTENNKQTGKSVASKVFGVLLGVTIGGFIVWVASLITDLFVNHYRPPSYVYSSRDILAAFIICLAWLGAVFLGGAVAGAMAGERGSRYGIIVAIIITLYLPPVELVLNALSIDTTGSRRAVKGLVAVIELAVLGVGLLLGRQGGILGVREAQAINESDNLPKSLN